jgi:hypothetical protein
MFSVIHRFVESSPVSTTPNPLQTGGGAPPETIDKMCQFVEGDYFEGAKPAEKALLRPKINA